MMIKVLVVVVVLSSNILKIWSGVKLLSIYLLEQLSGEKKGSSFHMKNQQFSAYF
jgi:hypothetical protein